MIIVIAGNYRQARDWAKRNVSGPDGRSWRNGWIYADRPEKLRGLARFEHKYVRTGTWYERDDLEHIIALVRVIGAEEIS